MKATYHAQNGRIHFEMDGDSPKAIWKKLALVQEVFDADDKCGVCDSTDIVFRTRNVDNFEFFEISCRDCSARLQFGQNKDGRGLFPKRKDEDGNWLDNRGWSKFESKNHAVGHNGRAENPPPPAPQRPTGGFRNVPLPSGTISDDDVPF